MLSSLPLRLTPPSALPDRLQHTQTLALSISFLSISNSACVTSLVNFCHDVADAVATTVGLVARLIRIFDHLHYTCHWYM